MHEHIDEYEEFEGQLANSDLLNELINLQPPREPAGLISRPNSDGSGILAQIEGNSPNLTYEPFTIRDLEAAAAVLDIGNHTPDYAGIVEWYRTAAMGMLGANQQPQSMRQLPVREIPESSIEEHIQNEYIATTHRDLNDLQRSGISLQNIIDAPEGFAWVIMDPPITSYTVDDAARAIRTRTITQTEEMRAHANMLEAENFLRDSYEQDIEETARQIRQLRSYDAAQQAAPSVVPPLPIAPIAPPEVIQKGNRITDCSWVTGSLLTTKEGAAVALKWKWWYDALSPILDGLFPQAWELKFVPIKENTQVNAKVTVLFPELTISDTVLTHKITDLYVEIVFANDMSLTGNFRGTRGSLTDVEYHSNYVHSHLPSGARESFFLFCKGDTYFNDIITKLGLQGFFTAEGDVNLESLLLFEACLHQLHAFVSHEATNGRPYYRIARIGTGASVSVSEEDQAAALRNFTRLAAGKELPILFDDRTPRLMYNEQLEEILIQCTTLTQFKDAAGKLYSNLSLPDSVRALTHNPGFATFLFRGEKVRQVITHPPETVVDITSKRRYCHETIKNKILLAINDTISRNITSWLVQSST